MKKVKNKETIDKGLEMSYKNLTIKNKVVENLLRRYLGNDFYPLLKLVEAPKGGGIY